MIGHTHTHYHVYIYMPTIYIYIYIQHSMIFGFGTLWRWNNKDNDYEPLDYFIVPLKIFRFRQLAQSHSDTGCFPPHQWIGSGNKIQETMFFWYFFCVSHPTHGVFLCEEPLLKPPKTRHFQWRKTTSCSLDEAMLFDVNIYPRDGNNITALPPGVRRRNMGGEPPFGRWCRWKIMKDSPVD